MGGEVLPRWGRTAGAETQECRGEGAPLRAASSPVWQEGVLAESIRAEEVCLPTGALSGAQREGNDRGGEASRET